jgi:hypothetical protein
LGTVNKVFCAPPCGAGLWLTHINGASFASAGANLVYSAPRGPITDSEVDIVHRALDFRRKWVAKPWLLAVALAGAAAIGGASPAAAGFFSPPGGTWCAMEAVGLNDCSYFSYQQCMATLSGVGGTCEPNLQAPPPAYPSPRRAKSKRRSYAQPYPQAYPPPYYPPPPPAYMGPAYVPPPPPY